MQRARRAQKQHPCLSEHSFYSLKLEDEKMSSSERNNVNGKHTIAEL
jgi:hypothetical protein